ncbi:MAG TPA: DinB family protein [Terriglobales bacterium]|nr:DinB family protein [Terriglobales bacterium]
MALGISFEDLLRYEEEQLQKWHDLFVRRPYLLKLEASPTETVESAIFHIFTAEYHSAQRLLGEEMTPTANLKHLTVDELFAIASEAHRKIRHFLAGASTVSLEELRTFPSTTLGEFTATPKKLLMHALVHSIRHWGQMARILRESGQRTDFSHDVLFSKVIQ